LKNRNVTSLSRRKFLSVTSTFAALLGAEIAFQQHLPTGLVPVALAADDVEGVLAGKSGLTLLNDRPVNAETPPHLLNDDITPARHLFVRNNGIPPQAVDVSGWTLKIGGESVRTEKTYTLAELKSRFTPVDLQLVLECGGNGRAEFYPPAKGNQWTLGAVGCPLWNGIRLRDVLEDCGIKDDAVYLAFYSADRHLSGDPAKHPISRGVPIAKAFEAESMLAWGMNGEDLHPLNGHPLRLVFGGWPGSTSGKWLNRIVIRDQVHDGAKMGGQSYRVPCKPVAPGTSVADEDMCIIESMPVKSLITAPKSETRHPQSDPLALHGHAWAGDFDIKQVDVSIDFGKSWQAATLSPLANRLAWRNFDHEVIFPKPGYYEVWARATDNLGNAQPMVVPGWNPKGYLNNACHRIAIYAV
jgi:DMSO/TMAO reductase YedYZ molybdopterin-dependent catalytic subunit